jgi:hypothetical protein
MNVVFRPENLRNVQPEMAPLLRAHWEEIALDHDAVPLDPDWPRYMALTDAGCLSMVTARVGPGGPLVGYHVAIIGGHLHYGSTRHGITDVYYLSPEHRKGFTGIRLFKAVDEEMKRLGVTKRITGTKVHLNMGPVLERLGYRLTEHVYTKILEV